MDNEERMCELCELYVYGCTMNTNQYNLCEGARCDEAMEYLEEELEEERLNQVEIIEVAINELNNE